MAEGSKIEWTDHTFNTWHGCDKVSQGCKHCYAETFSERFGGGVWGPDAPRKFMSQGYWEQPIKWNRKAYESGQMARVFCGSMCDVFEEHKDISINARMAFYRGFLLTTIMKTPSLMWLLLTKRPENVNRMISPVFNRLPDNVCIMTSVENQETADERIPELINIPAKYHGLSIEPLLSSVDLSEWISFEDDFTRKHGIRRNLDWVIVGGESGHKARPMAPGAVRLIRDQCDEYEVPFFFKQWGKWIHINHWELSMGGKTFVGYDYVGVGKKKAGRLLDGREHNDHPFDLDIYETMSDEERYRRYALGKW